MAKATWIKDNGQWRKAKSAWVNVGGTWKKDVMPKGVVSGGYREFMSYFDNLVILLRGNNYNANFLDIMDENLKVIQSINLNIKFNQESVSVGEIATDDKNNIYLVVNFNYTSATFYTFDKHLNIIRWRSLTNSYGVNPYKLTPMPSGEFYVSYGYYHSSYSRYYNVITELDNNYNVIWTKTPSSRAYNVATGNAVSSDGNIYVRSTYDSDSTYRSELRKYDLNGNVVKSVYFGVATSANTVECYENSVFTNDYSTVIKYDEDLNLVWEKNIGANVRVRDVDAFGNVYASVGGIVHKIDIAGNSTILRNDSDGLLSAEVDFKSNIYLAYQNGIRKYRPTGVHERYIPSNEGMKRICAYPGKYTQFKNAYKED